MASNKYVEPMEFFKVDKISDDVYAMGPNVILKFTVTLSKVANGKRYHFHKEYEYPSKCAESPTFATIKRSFDYYLSIENATRDANRNKVFIRIGTQEYMLFKMKLEEAISWFTDNKFSYLFARNNGRLVITAPIPEAKMNNLPMQKSLSIVPIIIDKGMANDDKEPGVRMYLEDESTYVDMDVDRLMGLYYVISCFNMYQAAAVLINYLERPNFGTNRFVIDSSNDRPFSSKSNLMPPKEGADGVVGRTVTPKGSSSMKDLE